MSSDKQPSGKASSSPKKRSSPARLPSPKRHQHLIVNDPSPKKHSLFPTERSFTYTTVVCDIEGTLTPISFVKDVLFPYVKNNVKRFIDENFDDSNTQQLVEKLKRQCADDRNAGYSDFVPIIEDDSDVETFKKSIVENIRWNMKHDRKVTALKAFQGFMWKEAYAKGEVFGEIFEDVLRSFKLWTKNNIPIYIYSSGSIEAQKLLFGHTKEGDLCHYLNQYFDTTIGPKLESSSYSKIAKVIGKDVKDILFLSDNPKELEAAVAAGFQVRLLIRPGNAKVDKEIQNLYHALTSLDLI